MKAILFFLTTAMSFPTFAGSCETSTGAPCSFTHGYSSRYVSVDNYEVSPTIMPGGRRKLEFKVQFTSGIGVYEPVSAGVQQRENEILLYCIETVDSVGPPEITDINLNSVVITRSKKLPVYVLEGSLDAPTRRLLGKH